MSTHPLVPPFERMQWKKRIEREGPGKRYEHVASIPGYVLRLSASTTKDGARWGQSWWMYLETERGTVIDYGDMPAQTLGGAKEAAYERLLRHLTNPSLEARLAIKHEELSALHKEMEEVRARIEGVKMEITKLNHERTRT